MQALLDTNAFLWWVTNDKKLSSTAHTIISNPQNEIFFSIVSGWEIVILCWFEGSNPTYEIYNQRKRFLITFKKHKLEELI
jgi:PIN domain nuclease of toxin-antitoxin system